MCTFDSFDMLHSSIQNHCINFSRVAEKLSDISGYPEEFISVKKDEIFNKLLVIYDQLTIPIPGNQEHIHPKNLLSYLELIQIHCPSNIFDTYSEKFLNIYCHRNQMKNLIEYENDLIKLINFIVPHFKQRQILVQKICIIILNRLAEMQPTKETNSHFVYYLIELKKLLERVHKDTNNKYTHFELIIAVVQKSILFSLELDNNKKHQHEIDHDKVYSLLSVFPRTNNDLELLNIEHVDIKINFEKHILEMIGELYAEPIIIQI